ncbi:MAG: hypothetical protein O7A09_07970 [Proteobacteria bacterium]|nr:hypothetical protein [Pseudomonadota bacterium]
MAAALLGFALWAVIDDPYQTEEFRRFHHERLIAFSPAAESYDVVVSGRSALMSALPPMDILAPLARARGLELRLLEIGVLHGTFRDLEPLLDDIRAAAPDLLVLELTLLVEDRTLTTTIQRKRGYLDWLLYRDGLWDPNGMTPQEFVDWLPPCEGSVAERNRGAQRRFPRYSRERRFFRTRAVAGASATAGRAFLREFMAMGGQAAVVSVPRRPAVEREFALWDAPDVEAYVVELGRDGVLAWPYRETHGDESFCDLTHLSASGRETYTHWFLDRIAAAARQGPGE